ncbi:MAG: helix-turn-helix transcriptional regulator [Planctomycetes bacterium]|nr:helix-turn-helix transcriptional regulator [Planctomycetota bacterium]
MPATLAALLDPSRPPQLQAAARVALAREVLGPGRRQDCHLIWLLHRGTYAGTVEGRPVVLEPGEALWIAPGQEHHLVASRPIVKTILRLRLDSGAPGGAPVRRLGVSAPAWFAALVGERRAVDLHRDERIRALFILLLTDWLRAAAPEAGGLGPQIRERLLQLVHADPRRRWNRATLARELGIAPATLARQVRVSCGMPLRRWLVEQRIRAAAEELAAGDEPVAAVARRHGYGEQFLFSRQFRAVLGTTPSAWRAAQG